MLGLQLATDPRWARIAESNLPELMTDHAYCEQKAASNAISLIVHYPDYPELVRTMARLAQEEMLHFEQVHAHMTARGWALGRERKDSYVNELAAFMRKEGPRELRLLDRLLFAAMIEARSCERFKLLAQQVQDAELAQFYRDLMASEAGHYTTFLNLARTCVDPEDVNTRWQQWLAHEAGVVARYGQGESVHG